MICRNRVAIVTGAGQGLGREHALALAAEGAVVVVNDLSEAAKSVAEEITTSGGAAVADVGDISDWTYAESLIHRAVEEFGTLDALVNNAGINRDRMLVSMTEADWDTALRVNLKGHAAPLHHAAAYWRTSAKNGHPVQARIINTTSGAGLLGSVGQGNYGAAKAGIAALTIIAAAELARYGVTVNAIAPSARTPMTEAVEAFADQMRAPETGFDTMHPANVSPLVVWLASTESAEVTGRVFEVEGGVISVADGWQHGPRAERDRRWTAAEVGPAVSELLNRAPDPAPVYGS
ncbi:SDR family oxidoreductase [Streptomyces acidiscabies]|uniref:SDR family oxidoreductase n=1 Tax=Streptomyces acidiscabies TaxID=42234 RepID=A0AAP6BEU9_9ACTN|nr:SDR family oxidoreductase [Streptomyces acidiscabies]MBP5934861.1 SDR family oxidoreductase [Streptomyces sp. LBUM 1476]MBZ3917380.1 SDR family oxidoreductase [Streptomyces acidiscabies]MDX2963463.1 SDR family oxidoreductase [Streptomyces acidiscabies]MDX3018760.1 SDR family oxidoreductase [Streptomyces acidiscabies]MDX3790568.1 SDR family oxidoreductase [Streptomyces acidiscabies]